MVPLKMSVWIKPYFVVIQLYRIIQSFLKYWIPRSSRGMTDYLKALAHRCQIGKEPGGSFPFIKQFLVPVLLLHAYVFYFVHYLLSFF
jgi:hypothetical protein